MKNKINTNSIIKYLLIPSGVLSIYLVSFSLFSSLMHIEGVNTVFADRAGKYMLYLTAVLGLFSLGLFLRGKNSTQESHSNTTDLQAIDLLLILLPLTPVVQYIVNNLGILNETDIIFVLAFFSIFSFIYIFLLPTLLGFMNNRSILAAIGVAYCMTFTSMSLLSQQFSWFTRGSLKIQLVYFLVIFFLAWLILNLKKQSFYIIVVIYFITNSSIQLVPKLEKVAGSEQEVID